MRLHLPPVLRRRFRMAWALVPPDVRERLGPRLRVRALARQIKSHRGWLVLGRYDPRTGIVYLHARLARGSRALAVAVALHELAHAADPRLRARRLHARDEAAAWDLVTAWVRGRDAPLTRAILAEATYRPGDGWYRDAPRWWSDNERQEDADLRAAYEVDDAFDPAD